jgi:hypothetical protein
VAVIVFWGLSGHAVHLRDGIVNRGDPLLTAWMLAWDQHQLVTSPFEFFQANIFHPFRDTLAYSEHVVGPALLAAPARLFTDNPIAVQNVSLLTAFVFLGLAAYLLFVWLSGSPVAAAAGAVLVALAPVRLPQLGHIQILHTAGIPLLLYGLWRFFEDRRPAAAAIFSAALAFEILSSFYLAALALFTFALSMALLPLARGWRETWAAFRRLSPWLAGVAAVCLPFVLPYFRLRSALGFSRGLEGNWDNWASHRSYFRPTPGSVTARLAQLDGLPVRPSLYVGAVVVVLALLAVVAIRSPYFADRRRAFGARFFLVLGAVAFAISLGGWRTLPDGRRLLLPFYYLHALPGFDGLRATIRFSVLVDLAAVSLAVLGLAYLERRLGDRVGRAGAMAVAAAVAIAAFLDRAPPLPLAPVERIEVGEGIPHVYRWLAGDAGARGVLELPMSVGPGEREPWDPVPYMQVYYSTVHWKRIVNGTSGYFPPGYFDLVPRMARFPSDAAFEVVRNLPINRVVVHKSLYPAELPSPIFGSADGFHVLHECGDDVVAEVRSKFVTRPLGTSVELLGPSPDDSSWVQLRWNPALPEFLYPPPEFRLHVETLRPDGSKHSFEIRQWLTDPRRSRVYRITGTPAGTVVSARVTAGANEESVARRKIL